MLVKLLPEQVSTHWKPIRRAISESTPPLSYGAEDRMDRILGALLTGTMQAWISHDSEGRVDNLLTTTITTDGITGVKNLLIYSMFGLETDRRSWYEGFIALAKFARANDCDRIVGYTKVSSITRFAQRFGGNTEYTFISVPIGERYDT